MGTGTEALRDLRDHPATAEDSWEPGPCRGSWQPAFFSTVFEKGFQGCCPGWPQAHFVAEDDFELLAALPLRPKCWDYRCVLLRSASWAACGASSSRGLGHLILGLEGRRLLNFCVLGPFRLFLVECGLEQSSREQQKDCLETFTNTSQQQVSRPGARILETAGRTAGRTAAARHPLPCPRVPEGWMLPHAWSAEGAGAPHARRAPYQLSYSPTPSRTLYTLDEKFKPNKVGSGRDEPTAELRAPLSPLFPHKLPAQALPLSKSTWAGPSQPLPAWVWWVHTPCPFLPRSFLGSSTTPTDSRQ